MPHEVRDQVVDFVRRWSEKSETGRPIRSLGVAGSEFYDWQERHGCVSEHNGWVLETSGWNHGRKKRSAGFIGEILGKAIGD